MITPSMLNMTATKISIEKGKTDAIKYAIGVSIVVFIQVYIAIIFTNYLRNNPFFVQSLQKIAIVIFILLSVYFFKQFKQDKNQVKAIKKNYTNSFSTGILLSLLNMFAIPFYCGVTTTLDIYGWFNFSQVTILLFVIGSTLGTFILLYTYSKYALIIQNKSKILSKNLNLVLSFLTGGFALITLIKYL